MTTPYSAFSDIKKLGEINDLTIAVGKLIERDLASREMLIASERLNDAKFVTFRTLLESNVQQVKLALDASKEAITKAENANEKRFEAVNGFRATLSDQAARFATRADIDSLKELIDRRMMPIERWQASELGKDTGVSQSVAIVLGGFGLIGTLLAIVGGAAALLR